MFMGAQTPEVEGMMAHRVDGMVATPPHLEGRMTQRHLPSGNAWALGSTSSREWRETLRKAVARTLAAQEAGTPLWERSDPVPDGVAGGAGGEATNGSTGDVDTMAGIAVPDEPVDEEIRRDSSLAP